MELEYCDFIGRGSTAEVWKARDPLMDRMVAVKFFNDASPTHAEREAIAHARALARVKCDAVVSVYAVERQRHPETGEDCIAIVMEHVDGVALSKHRERLSTSLARSILKDLASALDAIHTHGLVHGDLHDGNVVIGERGAKVIDILYTHSLAQVGARTAVRTQEEDLRGLSVLMRQVVEKAQCDERDSAEAYYQAATGLRGIAEMVAGFLAVLEPLRPPHVSSPTPVIASVAGGPERRVEHMTEDDLAELLASVDDAADHHVLWVTKTGEVRLSALDFGTPAHFAERHKDEMQFRWETFVCENDYCGEEAASDRRYVSKKLAELRQQWSEGESGYIGF